MKLVDMPDLGSGASRRGGSSPSTRTQKQSKRDGVVELDAPSFLLLQDTFGVRACLNFH